MPKSRTISDRKRAFLALQGTLLPRVGDRAVFVDLIFGALFDAEFSDDTARTVEVVRVSSSGATLWTRFVYTRGRDRFGGGQHRWRRWIEAPGCYRCRSLGSAADPQCGVLKLPR